MKKRPTSPAAAALLTFFGVLVVGTAILALVIGSAPNAVARLERGSQGLGSLGLILAVCTYFSARSRLRRWEAEQADEARAAKIRAGAQKLRGRSK